MKFITKAFQMPGKTLQETAKINKIQKQPETVTNRTIRWGPHVYSLFAVQTFFDDRVYLVKLSW